MNLIPRNQISDFGSLFDDFFTGVPMVVGKPGTTESLTGMRVDIHENDSQYEVIADLPGVKRADISVTLENDILTISASKETESQEKKRGKVIRRERSSGSYTRSFSVSHGIKQENIQANFKDGVLTLNVPKLTAEDAQPDVRKINID
ncbi:MAG: Hsp20/alpha crystallin family protein [Gammaproteobacteria bacterium]|nr:Hsp20/alpha crystallin family protein [Gammaproteobacteria bacterium]